MELKTCFSCGAEKQTLCPKRAGRPAPFPLPPARLTLHTDRLTFQGFGYGQSAPLFYSGASPLSIGLEDLLHFGPASRRRPSLLAAAVLCLGAAWACLFALPGLSHFWRALLVLDLALLSPAILLSLYFRWPAAFFRVQYRGGCLELPLRRYDPKDLQAFQAALEQALSFQRTEAAGDQAALALARAAALREYALLRRQGLLTEEEFRQAKAQTLFRSRRQP